MTQQLEKKIREILTERHDIFLTKLEMGNAYFKETIDQLLALYPAPVDRAGLREKIAKKIPRRDCDGCNCHSWDEVLTYKEKGCPYQYGIADSILALLPESQNTAREIGYTLCNLIGNLMLENMEAGKLLGKQLEPVIKHLQSLAGMAFEPPLPTP